MTFRILSTVLFLLLAGCTGEPDSVVAVGTLERDRAELRAPVSESVILREHTNGERVAKGDLILSLDMATATARLDQAAAQAAASKARLDEIRRGARKERIEQAQAALDSAVSEHDRAQSELERQANLAGQNLVSESQLEDARKTAEVTAANIERTRAALAELLNGATPEQLAQAEADVAASTARVDELHSLRDQLEIRAPYDGVIERVLVEPGDRVAAGTLLATVYRQGAPYASVFIPADMKASIKVGDTMAVEVDGNGCHVGTVRFVSSEAAYTPYYALREVDRGRLVYAAEIQLAESAVDLPTGIPAELLDSKGCPAE